MRISRFVSQSVCLSAFYAAVRYLKQRCCQRGSLHCALAAAQCIAIGPVCLFVAGCVCLFVCGWVCYHGNSKSLASIFTKLGLYVKVATISSWLNFGRPAPPGRGLRRDENFWLLTTASAQCLRLLWALFH